jgi:RimJ/RimL family protein N-acetyltransferase
VNHYARADAALGTFSLRPLDVDADVELLHSWVTHPKAAYWMMLDHSVEQVADEYRRIAAHPHHDAFLGFRHGRPAFLAERYDPAHVELAGLYDAQPGDVGMHFLCAPAPAPVHGFTHAVITTVMAWLFDDQNCHRVVVEPDIRNTAVHALNAAVGFTVVGPLQKPEKQALLSTCTRAQFLARIGVTS